MCIIVESPTNYLDLSYTITTDWQRYVVQKQGVKKDEVDDRVNVSHPIDGVLSLTPVVDLSLMACSRVESTRDSENIATAATVVNNQVNQGRIAA